jgi:hypothetical protein
MYHHEVSGKDHYIKVADKSFERVTKFKCLGMMVIDQNWIYE